MKNLIYKIVLLAGILALANEDAQAQRRLTANLVYSPISFDWSVGSMCRTRALELKTSYYRKDKNLTSFAFQRMVTTYTGEGMYSNLRATGNVLQFGQYAHVFDTEMDDDWTMYLGVLYEIGLSTYEFIDPAEATESDNISLIDMNDEIVNRLHGSLYCIDFFVEKNINAKFTVGGDVRFNVLASKMGIQFGIGANYRLY